MWAKPCRYMDIHLSEWKGASTYSLSSWMGIMWSNELCVHSINIFTCGWYRVVFFNSIPSKHLNSSVSPATYYCAINLNLNQLLLTQLQIPYYTELLYIMRFINILQSQLYHHYNHHHCSQKIPFPRTTIKDVNINKCCIY